MHGENRALAYGNNFALSDDGTLRTAGANLDVVVAPVDVLVGVAIRDVAVELLVLQQEGEGAPIDGDVCGCIYLVFHHDQQRAGGCGLSGRVNC